MSQYIGFPIVPVINIGRTSNKTADDKIKIMIKMTNYSKF